MRTDQLRGSVPTSRLTLAEAGRYSPQYRRAYSDVGRPANFSWCQGKTTDSDKIDARDITWGVFGAENTYDCSISGWTGGPRIEAITHWTSADLPSNGFGISYGDAHNSTFHTVLASSLLVWAVATQAKREHTSIKTIGYSLPIGV